MERLLIVLRTVLVAWAAGAVCASAQTDVVEVKPATVKNAAEARQFLLEYLRGSPRIYTCSEATMGWGFRRVSSPVLTEETLTFSCGAGLSRTVRFKAMPRTWQTGKDDVCVGVDAWQDCLTMRGLQFTGIADVQGFVDAWSALSKPAPLLAPAQDMDFQAAVARARASGIDHSEARRRAQIQSEAMVQAGQQQKAAEILREALKEMPDWAAGHYNLALIAGLLQRYAEAITEMRRYLYLAPNADDARAAQDQIYKWEALMVQ